MIWCGWDVEMLVVYRRRTTEYSPDKMLANTPLRINSLHPVTSITLIHDVILRRNPIANSFVISGMVGYCFCSTTDKCFLSGKIVSYVEEFYGSRELLQELAVKGKLKVPYDCCIRMGVDIDNGWQVELKISMVICLIVSLL